MLTYLMQILLRISITNLRGRDEGNIFRCIA
jgi:hypothetical protein